jgi:hypothetical protein
VTCWLEKDGKPVYFVPQRGFVPDGSLAFPHGELAERLWPEEDHLSCCSFGPSARCVEVAPHTYLHESLVTWKQMERVPDQEVHNTWRMNGRTFGPLKRFTLISYDERE